MLVLRGVLARSRARPTPRPCACQRPPTLTSVPPPPLSHTVRPQPQAKKAEQQQQRDNDRQTDQEFHEKTPPSNVLLIHSRVLAGGRGTGSPAWVMLPMLDGEGMVGQYQLSRGTPNISHACSPLNVTTTSCPAAETDLTLLRTSGDSARTATSDRILSAIC